LGAARRKSHFCTLAITLQATYPKGRTVHPHPTINFVCNEELPEQPE
jgi:hypothetical protein